MAAVANKVVKQLAGSGTGQSLKDRVQAASFSLAGSALGKSVCKATTEELNAPKKKHVDYLIQASHEPNVSIPSLADHILKRLNDPNWVVVFKGLITMHNVMNFGNERFSQYLASSNCQISLPGYADRSGSQSFDMSELIKEYSKYIHEKTNTYRLMAFDFCKIKRGKDDGVLRTMALPKLLKTLPILQNQMDILLEFEATPQQMSNPIVKTAFMLLYKDMIRLFASYNEGMINMIEKYFSMKRKQCKQSLALYKGFIKRMDKVSEFVTIAEGIGCGDKESLGLQPVPEKVVKALEHHLSSLEKKKKLNKTNSSDSASSLPASPVKETCDKPAVSATTASKTGSETPSDNQRSSQQSTASAIRPQSSAPLRPSSPVPPRPVSPVPPRPNEKPQIKATTPSGESDPPPMTHAETSPPTAAVKVQQKTANITVNVSSSSGQTYTECTSNDLFDLVDFGSGTEASPAQGNSSFNPFATIEDPADDELGLPAASPLTHDESPVGTHEPNTNTDAEGNDMWLEHHDIIGDGMESLASIAEAMVLNHAGDIPGTDESQENGLEEASVAADSHPTQEDNEKETNQETATSKSKKTELQNNDDVTDLFGIFGGPVDSSPVLSSISTTSSPQPAQPKASSALNDIFSLDPFSSNFVNLPEESTPKVVVDPLEKLKHVSNHNTTAAASPARRNQPQKNLLDTDLDSTLASLAGSLSVSPTKTKWAQPMQPTKLTGGSCFSHGVSPGPTISWNANKDTKPKEKEPEKDPFGDLFG